MESGAHSEDKDLLEEEPHLLDYYPDVLLQVKKNTFLYTFDLEDVTPWEKELQVIALAEAKVAQSRWFMEHLNGQSRSLRTKTTTDGREFLLSQSDVARMVKIGAHAEIQALLKTVYFPTEADLRAKQAYRTLPKNSLRLRSHQIRQEQYPQAFGKYFRMLYERCIVAEFPTSLPGYIQQNWRNIVLSQVEIAGAKIDAHYLDWSKSGANPQDFSWSLRTRETIETLCTENEDFAQNVLRGLAEIE
ncbi:hypothetical protein COW46_00365 [Candidatus Gracilibacteria bacterium CG17_big_fil_post_rev_8_21_14_2_50_48_13]|nr:MAG: hypothetical protein COW46_00365 [Candidatus Gracilibacteria bacterium CG17_big_fil_post_rev_8_21_14_2_50_48_13]